jgi:MFS superfamily sulfate permease-like transporter
MTTANKARSIRFPILQGVLPIKGSQVPAEIWALDFKAHLPVLGAVPSGLPHIGLPQVQWSWELIGKMAPKRNW